MLAGTLVVTVTPRKTVVSKSALDRLANGERQEERRSDGHLESLPPVPGCQAAVGEIEGR